MHNALVMLFGAMTIVSYLGGGVGLLTRQLMKYVQEREYCSGIDLSGFAHPRM